MEHHDVQFDELQRVSREHLVSALCSFNSWYRAETVLAEWQTLSDASNAIYNKLSSAKQPSFFQLVQHPVQASNTLAKMLVYAGINNLHAEEARLSANSYDDQVTQLFEQDYEWEKEYHTILDGKYSSDALRCILICHVP